MPTTSARLLALLSLLQTRRDWPGELLAERMDVHVRTVRRDVDRLRQLGYRISSVKGPDGGYRLDAGATLPPLLLDDDQAVALAVALQIATTAGAGIEESALQALTTVRQVMPARLRHRVDALRLTAVQPPTSDPSARADSAVLASIGAAVHAREVLRFDYASVSGHSDEPPRRVEPHHLVTWGGRWYLVGWDLERVDWRTYRVDRISPRTPTGPRFTERELPGGDVATFVTGRFRGNEGSTQWPCLGVVLLHLPAAEVQGYTRDGIVEAVDPARCRLTLGAWSWLALAAALSRFDAEVEVVEPRELAEAFGVLAERSARAAGSLV